MPIREDAERAEEFDQRTVLDGLRDAVVAATLDGTIVYANRAVEHLLGWAPDSLVGAPVTELIPPRLRAAHTEGMARYRESGVPHLIGQLTRVPARRADGSELDVELALAVTGTGAGGIVVASMRDLSEVLELERRSRLARYLTATNTVALQLGATRPAASLAEAAPVVLSAVGSALGWLTGNMWEVDDDTGTLQHVNSWTAAGADTGSFNAVSARHSFRPGQGLPGRVWASAKAAWVVDVTKDRNFTRAAEARQAGLRGGVAFPILGGGERVLGAVEFFDRQPHEADEDLLEVLEAIGRQVGQFVERGRADRRARSQLRFLAEASRVLDASLEFEATLQQLANLTVPYLGDVCMIDVVEDEERPRRAAWAARAPHVARALRELAHAFPGTPPGTVSAAAITTAGVQVVDHVTDELLKSHASDDPHHLSLLRMLELRSMLAVPLVARGRVLGAITLGAQADRGAYGDEDVAVALELARRAAVAVDNARLYAERTAVARTLQQSLLPRSLPAVPGASVAADYQPGSGDEVGGDFYDVYERADGETVIVVGDVCGKDTEAAAMTGLVRHTLRALDHLGHDASDILHCLNAILCSSDFSDRFCTVGYVRWTRDGDHVTARVVSAGHPLPLVRRADGRVETVGKTGDLIGVFDDVDTPETAVELRPGDTLVLYTDGVLERRRPDGEFYGDDRLRDAVRAGGERAEDVVRSVVDTADRFAPDAPRDDVAVLAIRVEG